MVVLNGYLLHVGTASFTDPVEVWFEWGTSPSPRIYLHQTQVQSLSQPGAFRHVISPLDPDTTYYFRAAARFDRFYEYGEERSFRPADLMKVIIVSHGMATDAYGDPVVAVEVRNTSTQTVSYAMVTVECKDASGAALQTSVGAASQLVPNQSSKFDVPVPVGTASYDIFVDQVYIP
jgi:hypothetical protein